MRLRKLQEELSDKFTITHRAFILRPDHNPDATFLDYHLQHRQRAREMTGLPFALPKPGTKYPTSSFPAQQAAKWTQLHEPESFDKFDAALFSAFLERAEDISNLDILAEIATHVGINDVIALKAAVDDEQIRNEVMSDHHGAQRLGINGIPAVVIGNQIITGAVPIDAYRESLEQHDS